MNKIDVRREVATLSNTQIAAIGQLTAALAVTGHNELSDVLVNTLDKYEEEIIRLQAANARLRQKNRNYRTGMKSLQRAHEATLHRERVAQETNGQLKQIIEQGGVCGVEHEGEYVGFDGPYTPVRFNNDQPEPIQVSVSKQSVEYSN